MLRLTDVKRYKINEIFYSIQGEGYNAGCAAVFVRFSGCNLRCPFCDTQHEAGRLMTAAEICAEIRKYPAGLVVLTGGEPALFADAPLCDAIHALGCRIAIETNGTRPIDGAVDHVTCSPKFEFCPPDDAAVCLSRIDELKVVWTGRNDMAAYEGMDAGSFFLQPCDTGDAEQNRRLTHEAIAYVLQHPKWRLSLQLHKIVGVR